MEAGQQTAFWRAEWFRRPYRISQDGQHIEAMPFREFIYPKQPSDDDLQRGYMEAIEVREHPEAGAAEAYDPFRDGYFPRDSPANGASIYLRLVGLNLDAPHEIALFCSEWGLLGLYQHGLREWIWPSELDGEPVKVRIGDADKTEVVPARQYCPRYFNRCDEQNGRIEIPNPLNSPESFWQLLSEPLREFRQAAEELRTVFNDLVRWGQGERLPAYITPGFDPQFVPMYTNMFSSQIPVRVNRHLQGRVSPRLEGPDEQGRWRCGWSFPSLLSVLYMMLLQDHAAGRRMARCADERCNQPFVADRPDRVFCTRACANRVQQRKFYQRKNRPQ